MDLISLAMGVAAGVVLTTGTLLILKVLSFNGLPSDEFDYDAECEDERRVSQAMGQ